jgi:hypothetical protein
MIGFFMGKNSLKVIENKHSLEKEKTHYFFREGEDFSPIAPGLSFIG